MTVSNYLAIAGGVALVLALLLSLVSKGRTIKIPAVLLGVAAGFALGGASGIILMGIYEKETKLPFARSTNDDGMNARRGMGGMGGGPGGMFGGGPGMMMMGGPGRGPTSKTQLAGLVAKLDQLTLKPLTVQLGDVEKAKIREQLQGLADLKELGEDEAKKRLDAILALLKDQKETIESAGYRWPGGDGGRFGGAGPLPPPESDNPFKDKETHNHLDSFLKTIKEELPKI